MKTWPGHMTWCGVGLRGHHETEHWVIDLTKASANLRGHTLYTQYLVKTIKGRLSKIKLAEIEAECELESETNTKVWQKRH
jgi:hypothetical protein